MQRYYFLPFHKVRVRIFYCVTFKFWLFSLHKFPSKHLQLSQQRILKGKQFTKFSKKYVQFHATFNRSAENASLSYIALVSIISIHFVIFLSFIQVFFFKELKLVSSYSQLILVKIFYSVCIIFIFEGPDTLFTFCWNLMMWRF